MEAEQGEVYIMGHKQLGLFMGYNNGHFEWSSVDPHLNQGLIPALPSIEYVDHWIHRTGCPVEDFLVLAMPRGEHPCYDCVEVLIVHGKTEPLVRQWTLRLFDIHVPVFHDTVQ